MNRRAFVVGSVAGIGASIAGCVTDSGSWRLSVEPFGADHVSLSTDDLSPEQASALETIRTVGGHVTFGYTRFNAPGERAFLELDDYYRVHVEESGELVITRNFMRAEVDASEEAVANAVPPETVYDEADQRRIERAVERMIGGSTYLHYVFRTVRADETDLLSQPTQEFVELALGEAWIRPQTFRLRTGYGEIPETEYTTTIEPVASTPDDLVRHLDDEGLVRCIDGDELSAGARDRLETAIEDGTTTQRRSFFGGGEPFDGLDLDPVGDPETDWPYRIVRYDGEYYTWSISFTVED